MAPVIVVTIHIAIIPSMVSVIAAFEEIQIVNPVPGHVAREAVTTVQVPMPKFPVSLKPGRKGPRPACADASGTPAKNRHTPKISEQIVRFLIRLVFVFMAVSNVPVTVTD
jgi:hypothetical protein